MKIDLYVKSQQLLEALANSIHDREKKSNSSFFFNIQEVHIAEKYLKELIKEVTLDCVCLE